MIGPRGLAQAIGRRYKPMRVPPPNTTGTPRLPEEHARSVVVVGGGIGGAAAATILGERGVRVTLLEREETLGGRARAWKDRLQSGEAFEMERGFHGFFRQYYNLRALMRRFDPQLRALTPLRDYPLLARDGRAQSFTGLPKTPLLNVAALVQRTRALGWRDLLRVQRRVAAELLRYDEARTYAAYDHHTARDYLEALQFPRHAKELLFDVFSHSFFNPEGDFSAAELLMMFHFYFLGNPEGLVFDVLREPFDTALWVPWGRHLHALGARVETGTTALRLRRTAQGWRVQGRLADGSVATYEADAVVLAVTVPALRALVADSPEVGDAAWRSDIDALGVTLPFAVWRLWLDRPTAAGRTAFAGTAGFRFLDNISLYHLFEGESARWAARTGGAIVELHAYAVPEDATEADVRAELLEGLHALYPETRGARVLEERWLWKRDCPAFPPGTYARRPRAATPDPSVALAGDFVRTAYPSALMERAAATGIEAANHLLAAWGVRGEWLTTVPHQGLLAPLS